MSKGKRYANKSMKGIPFVMVKTQNKIRNFYKLKKFERTASDQPIFI
jgi:hypothetical protein